MIKGDSDYIHVYKIQDNKGRPLNDHCGIWLLALDKFNAQSIETEQQRWLRFFNEGERLNDNIGLPDWMTTQEMSTLRQFSEKEQNYHAYQARQEFLREQLTIQHELDAERKAKVEAIEREQIALEREQKALEEIERLKALLAKNLNS